MASTMTLRPRRAAEDAEAIARLILESNSYYSALAPELFAKVEEDGLAAWLASDLDWLSKSTSLALVAEVDGEFAGYLEAAIQEPEETARFAGNTDARERRVYINFVVTAEAHKRKGVATRLVEAAEEWARDRGVSLVLCDTYINSPQSIPFLACRLEQGEANRALRSCEHGDGGDHERRGAHGEQGKQRRVDDGEREDDRPSSMKPQRGETARQGADPVAGHDQRPGACTA